MENSTVRCCFFLWEELGKKSFLKYPVKYWATELSLFSCVSCRVPNPWNISWFTQENAVAAKSWKLLYQTRNFLCSTMTMELPCPFNDYYWEWQNKAGASWEIRHDLKSGSLGKWIYPHSHKRNLSWCRKSRSTEGFSFFHITLR